MRSSLSPYVLKSSANNSKGKNVYNNHSGISYKQSAIDATLEKLSDYIRSNISDKITIDIGLSLVEDTREIFQRTLRDKVSSSSTIDKENINTFSSNISKEMSYFNDPSNTSPSKEHFESLASRESMVSMLSRPSVGEVLINSSTDNVTPQNIVDQQSSSPMFSTITRRSKRNKNGNLISSSKVTFADIISPAAASNVNKDQKSAKSSTSKLKQAPSSMVKCHDLDTTLKLDSLTADSSSLCRSSVYSASSVLDTTLVYDPTVDDDVNEENILSPHRFSLLDRTMLEASAEKNDSEKFSSSFNLNDESYRVLLSPTKEDTIIRESKPIQLSEEDSNTPFKVMKRGRKGRKSVSGHIFKLERFRDEEPGELDEVKNAMENMTLGHYDDEAVNIVGIPFSPHTQERLSVIEDESGQSYSTESMALDNASSPTKELDQQEGSSDIAARRPTRRASVQCKEKISDVDNAKDKRMKKTKPPESKPIKRIESVYQSLTTLQASIIDKSFLLLEELSVESFTEARGRVEAVVSHLNNGAYSESAETTALALLLAISNVPNGYPQSVFEYLIMLPELMRPSSCESIINHTDNTTIGGRGTKHVRFAPLDGSAMTPPGSLPHNAIAPVFSTYIRLRQISELISKLIETLHNSDQQWALSVLLQTTQILSKAPAVKLLCASLGDVVDTEFIQQHFSLVFSELSHHLAPTCTWTSGVVPSLPYRCSWLLASVLRSQVRVVLDPPPVQTYTVNNSAVTPSVVKGLTKAASVPLYELIELKPPLSSSPGNKSKSKKKPATEEEEFALSAPVEELGVSAVLNKAVVIIAEFLSRRALKHSPTATMYNVLSSFKESGSWDEVRLSEWVAAELSSSHIKDMIMTAQISLAAERARKFLWHLLSPSQVREVFLDRSSISVPPSTDNPAILYQLFSEGDTSSVTDVFDLQLSPWSVMQKCAEILFHDGALEEPHYALFSTDYDSFLKMVSRPFLDADVRKECEEIVQNIPLLPTVHAIYSPSNSKSRRKGPGKDDKSAKKLAKTIRNIESLASLDKYVIEDLLLVHSDLIFEFPVVHIQKK